MSDQFVMMTALQEQVAVAADSIVSRTLFTGDDARVILFIFAPG